MINIKRNNDQQMNTLTELIILQLFSQKNNLNEIFQTINSDTAIEDICRKSSKIWKEVLPKFINEDILQTREDLQNLYLFAENINKGIIFRYCVMLCLKNNDYYYSLPQPYLSTFEKESEDLEYFTFDIEGLLPKKGSRGYLVTSKIQVTMKGKKSGSSLSQPNKKTCMFVKGKKEGKEGKGKKGGKGDKKIRTREKINTWIAKGFWQIYETIISKLTDEKESLLLYIETEISSFQGPFPDFDYINYLASEVLKQGELTTWEGHISWISNNIKQTAIFRFEYRIFPITF